jgi:hypothetical protein
MEGQSAFEVQQAGTGVCLQAPLSRLQVSTVLGSLSLQLNFSSHGASLQHCMKPQASSTTVQ